MTVVTFTHTSKRPPAIRRFPVKRETNTSVYEMGQSRPIIVTLHPGYISLRLKGRRLSFDLGYETAYRAAILAERQRQRDERKRKRKEQ